MVGKHRNSVRFYEPICLRYRPSRFILVPTYLLGLKEFLAALIKNLLLIIIAIQIWVDSSLRWNDVAVGVSTHARKEKI